MADSLEPLLFHDQRLALTLPRSLHPIHGRSNAEIISQSFPRATIEIYQVPLYFSVSR